MYVTLALFYMFYIIEMFYFSKFGCKSFVSFIFFLLVSSIVEAILSSISYIDIFFFGGGGGCYTRKYQGELLDKCFGVGLSNALKIMQYQGAGVIVQK